MPSSKHTPDPEFVEYLETEIKNPYLSAATVMWMERVFIDQRDKYEAALEAARQAPQDGQRLHAVFGLRKGY